MARWWPRPASDHPDEGDLGTAAPGAGNESREERRPGRRHLGLAFAAAALVLGAAVVHEVRTSFLQAAVFTRIASSFGWVVDRGPSELIRFPAGGPHDDRLGYSRIPALIERLGSQGFDLTHQARMTPALLRWIDWGGYPTYRDKGPTGLRVRDETGARLSDLRFPTHTYEAFDSIPDIVWRTLVHIESQGILDQGGPFRNPAVEWDRLAFGAATLALRELGLETSVPGGSTLATQIEKYRHSPGGYTASPREKLRQMLTASVRAYGNGPATLGQRRDIILAYLNSVPLAAQIGHGEVVGLGEALWTWYGTPSDWANAVLRARPTSARERVEYARLYRQVLGLLVAQRRPTFYLTSAEGRRSLAHLTRVYLDVLKRDGVIPAWLAHYARNLPAEGLRSEAPPRPLSNIPAGPGLGSVRADLLKLTGAANAYALDRLDLSVVATLDSALTAGTADVLQSMNDPEFLADHGFRAASLLARGDPSRVLYSVLLLERTDVGNVVRVEADNLPGDMSLAASSRLELGSTAKLRTLTTYLEVVEEIYGRLVPLDDDALRATTGVGTDILTSWVAGMLLEEPRPELGAVLEASMLRTYSASPRERFRTGGAEMTFSNFDSSFDHRTLTVSEAFRHSVNLPFIRLMRDLVTYEMARLGTAELLSTAGDARRRDYLVKFAQHEGAEFVRRFHRKYAGRSGPEIFVALLAERSPTAIQAAWAVRSVAPDVPPDVFADLLRTHARGSGLSDEQLVDLYVRVDPSRLPLSDLGYLSRVHPLELWVASERLNRPAASLADILQSGRPVVEEVYGWLLRTTRQKAQDVRIFTMLEIEAFQQIHERWRRLGYPFADLTPALGTAIGSSGDRPLALAELAAVIQNDGVRLPVVRVEAVQIAEGTPFESRMRRAAAAGERVMGAEVARVLRAAMVDVVTQGTGRRALGALTDSDGRGLKIGGKTGTGDNRYAIHDARGRLVESRVLSRTASLVFMAGDRYTGMITVLVEGSAASEHRFTSALASQLLNVLGEQMSLPASPSAFDEPASPPAPTEAPWWVSPSPPLRMAMAGTVLRLPSSALPSEPLPPARSPESQRGSSELAVLVPGRRVRFEPA